VNKGVTISHEPAPPFAKVVLAYRGRVAPPPGLSHFEIECEIYRSPEGIYSVHSVCPKCHHGIWIDGANKSVEFDPEKGLFVASFGCTWEMDAEHQAFGLSLCGLRLEYAGREARDA
jgi:hypothetical protein